MPTIFLSSTAKDLGEHRAAVIRAIRKLDGYFCICMEDFGARHWDTDEFCRRKVAESDLFIGLLGHFYGTCPKASEISYTEREYNVAVAASRPRLMFLATDDFPMPASLRESQIKWRKQQAFRRRISGERLREIFTTPEDLALKVTQAIQNQAQDRTRTLGEDAEEAYLQYVTDRFGKLTLYSLTSDAPLAVDLERVFVKLNMTNRRSMASGATIVPRPPQAHQPIGNNALGQVPIGNSRNFANFQHFDPSEASQSIAEALHSHMRLMIVGAPGTGKTTLLKHLALTFARRMAKDRLQLEEERLPVFISLRDFNRFLNNLDKQGRLGALSPLLLPHFLQQHTTEVAPHVKIPSDFFDQALLRRRCIVLLDGLDEVADPLHRARTAEAVGSVAAYYQGNRFVVTCRPRGYEGEARLRLAGHFSECVIREFDDTDRATFAYLWYTAVVTDREGDTPTSRERARNAAIDLLRVIHADSKIAALACNPLLLSILSLVHQRGAGVSSARVELYEQCTDLLLGYWDQVDKPDPLRELANLGGLSRREKRALVEPIALWLHERGAAGLEVSASELEEQIAHQFCEMLGDSDTQARRRAESFLLVIIERTSLLVEPEPDVFAFAHLTFQEYLAARALADRSDYISYTIRHLHDPWWREVILLEVGHLSMANTRRSRELTTNLVRAIRTGNNWLEDVLKRDLLLACRALTHVGLLGVEEQLRNEIFGDLFVLWRTTPFDVQRAEAEDVFRCAVTTTDGELIRNQLTALLHTRPEVLEDGAVGSGSSTFSVGDFVGLPSLASKLQQRTRAFDTWLAGRLSSATQAALSRYAGQSSDPTLLQQSLLRDLNGLLVGASLYDNQRFDGIVLRVETMRLMSENPQGSELARFNRLLIEDAYPLELSRTLRSDLTTVVRERAASERARAGAALSQLQRSAEFALVAIPWMMVDTADDSCRVSAAMEVECGALSSELLMQQLRDTDSRVREAAVERLGSMDISPVMLRDLVNLLGAEDAAARHSAARLVSKLGPAAAGQETLDCLLKLSHEPEAQLRLLAADGLGRTATMTTVNAALTRLRELSEDENPGVRKAVAVSLESIGREFGVPLTVQQLVGFTRDIDGQVRLAAAEALGRLSLPRDNNQALLPLVTLIEDEDSDVRRAAAHAVGQLCKSGGASGVLNRLLQLTKSEDFNVRGVAAEAIGLLGHRAEVPEVMTRLSTLLQDSHVNVRWTAAIALGNLARELLSEELAALIVEFWSPQLSHPQSRQMAYQQIARIAELRSSVRIAK